MILVNEIFASIQGEGPAMGLPCVFVRLAGCPLRCVYCDTPRASWDPQGDPWSVDRLARKLEAWPGMPVVITGGEPLIFEELEQLCRVVRGSGRSVHIETSGVIFRDVEADLVCVSPKLSSSAPSQAPWKESHMRRIGNIDALQAWRDWNGGKAYFKYVVSTVEDIDEVLTHIQTLHLPRDRVYLMPQASEQGELATLGPQVAHWCLEHGLRYSDRLHIRLWNNEPGR